MNAVLYGIRRYGPLIVAVGLTMHYGYAAHVHSARLTEACNAFMEVDSLIDRGFPDSLPSREQVDRNRQTIAGLCSAHFVGFSYPEDPEGAPIR